MIRGELRAVLSLLLIIAAAADSDRCFSNSSLEESLHAEWWQRVEKVQRDVSDAMGGAPWSWRELMRVLATSRDFLWLWTNNLPLLLVDQGLEVLNSAEVIGILATSEMLVGTNAQAYYQRDLDRMAQLQEKPRSRTHAELRRGLARRTLTVNGACSFNSNTSGICEDAMNVLGAATNMNIYVSPGGQPRSVALHSDGHSSFVVQTEGSKHWRVCTMQHVPNTPNPNPKYT